MNKSDFQTPLLQRPNASARRVEHQYFWWTAAAIAIFVLVGFSRTYYFRSFFAMPDLSIFLHIHAAVMSGWIVLYLVQTTLVSVRRVAVHRALGIFGAGYAALVVALGSTATLLAAHREVRGHTTFVYPTLIVLSLELTQMFLFAGLVSISIWVRNRTDYHKRLMLLASLLMLPNVFVRLLVNIHSNLAILGMWTSLVAGLVAIDCIRSRKLHPAFAIGAVVVVLSMYLAYFVGITQLWQHSAARIVGSLG